MIQLARGRNQRIGYFLRGARAFAPERPLTALMRLMMGLLFTTYERTVAGIQCAVADAPSPTAMRAFVRSKPLASKLSRIVDWKRGQNVRNALRMATGHRGPIILAIDSTFKGTLSRRARLKFLVSDLQDAKTVEIVRLYARRWDIELFFRDAKLYLGLDDYRLTGQWAPPNIAMFVVLTYQFLHWQGTTCGPPSSTLTRIRAFGDQVDADNVAAVVRAFVTRHGPSRILSLLREVRCAHAS